MRGSGQQGPRPEGGQVTRPDPLLAGLLVGATVALAILAGAALVGAVLYPDTHWRGGALALVATPAVLLGAREALYRRTHA